MTFFVAEEHTRSRSSICYPYECRQDGPMSPIKWNGPPGLLALYCPQCEALHRFNKCLRAEPLRRLKLLYPERYRKHDDGPNMCPRCGSTFSYPARICDECAEAMEATNPKLRAQPEKDAQAIPDHPCAFPGCEHLIIPGKTWCLVHMSPAKGRINKSPDELSLCNRRGCNRQVPRGALYCPDHSPSAPAAVQEPIDKEMGEYVSFALTTTVAEGDMSADKVSTASPVRTETEETDGSG